MYKFIVKIVSTFIILFAPLSASEESFVEKIQLTVDALSSEKDLVWKKFDLLETPLVITFSNEHIYAFGLKKNHAAWQEKKIGNSAVLFSEKDHWNLKEIAMQDQFLLDGQKVFVFRIDEETNPNTFVERPILVLVHELFHRYQFGHFERLRDVGQYADSLNIENLALIHLEERILIDFVTAEETDKLNILKNYMAVHQARSKIISPSSLNWEYFQQMMEGLADYASIQTFKTFPVIPGFSEKKHLFHLFSGYVHSQDPQELAVKWRHYGVGAMVGFALDFLNVQDWKERVETGEAQGIILKEALALKDEEVFDRLELMKTLYGYDAIFLNIEQNVNDFEKKLENYLAAYEAEKGIVAHIGRPFDASINGGGSNYGIFHLQDGNTMLVKDRSFSSTADNLWEIEFKDVPLFFQDKAGDRIVKVDPDLKLLVDGVSYSAKELIETKAPLSFESIYWDCSTSRFKSSGRTGELYFNEEGFFVNFYKRD
ncbi:MAG TPA: hypothetical protein PLC42_07495 [Parachlamydiaceae bacterium]|nr:hypothetical protein [Parachlamydiaceae bacterium]